MMTIFLEIFPINASKAKKTGIFETDGRYKVPIALIISDSALDGKTTELGLNWVCFYVSRKPAYCHNILSMKVLRQIILSVNWVCFFKSQASKTEGFTILHSQFSIRHSAYWL
jgi:hypothetical protein